MRMTLTSGKTIQYFVQHVATPSGRMSPKGKPCMVPTGVTKADIYDESGALLGQGKAVCHENDVFRKQVGVRTALTRALQTTGLTRAERSEVWKKVWNASAKATA